jgi:hypothetical protein
VQVFDSDKAAVDLFTEDETARINQRYLMNNLKSSRIIIIITIILAVGVFYTATIREGHNWGDDFSMYIHHAKNIVEGVKYDDTGYLRDSHLSVIGPKAYPPVFPLLLSPVYRYFGLNLTAMKIEVIFFFLLSLFSLYLLFKDELPLFYILALMLVTGFSPLFWYLKDQVISEFPFMFFVFISLYSINKIYQAGNIRYHENLNALIIAGTIYMSYGTRTIGIILLPSLLVYDLVKRKKPTLLVIKATFLVVLGILIQNLYLHTDTDYLSTFNNFTWSISEALHSIGNIGRPLDFIPARMNSAVFIIIIPLIILILTLYGLYSKMKDKVSCTEIFLILYVLSLIPWIIVIHGRGLRYFVPILPLVTFYVLKGFLAFNVIGSRSKEIAFTISFGLVLAFYVYFYACADYGAIRPGISDTYSKEFFDYSKNNIEPGAVFVFKKPRALVLFTGKKTSTYPVVCEEKIYWRYFKSINASYLVLGPIDEVFFGTAKQKDRFFVKFLIKNRNCLTQVYANLNFRIYRIDSLPN